MQSRQEVCLGKAVLEVMKRRMNTEMRSRWDFVIPGSSLPKADYGNRSYWGRPTNGLGTGSISRTNQREPSLDANCRLPAVAMKRPRSKTILPM